MQIGIFAKTFPRPTLEGTLDAVAEHGIRIVQFNMNCAGLPSMPDRIEPTLAARIRGAIAARGMSMAAVSGTFNMIHPDVDQRRAGLDRLSALAAAAAALGTGVITISTGTRHAKDMWRGHPENGSRDAWREMVASLAEAVRTAERHAVTLAFEPEVSNVVDTAQKARTLLDEIRSPHLKVVLDPANLFHAGTLPRMAEILDTAFDLLGPDIVLAHAKDLSGDGEAGHAAAGTGLLDYDRYLALLGAVGRDVPLILHGLSEAQVRTSVAFLLGKGAHLDAEGMR